MSLPWWEVVLIVLGVVLVSLSSTVILIFLFSLIFSDDSTSSNQKTPSQPKSFHSLIVNINDNDKLLQDPLRDIDTTKIDIPDDSFTSHLQSLDNYIKRVEDPYSKKFIEIGNIVCVIKSFHGKKAHEFPILHHGDLIRIIRFHIVKQQDEYKPLTLSKSCEIEIDEVHEIKQSLITKKNPEYLLVYCTGIILNTYLEMSPYTKDLNLKISTGLSNLKYLLKDFPLNIVSLETTVLESIHD